MNFLMQLGDDLPATTMREFMWASGGMAYAFWCDACRVHHPRESVFRAAPLLGRLVLNSTAPVLLARAETWLGADAGGDGDALRIELLRRYLHCYAPTTSGHFAEWAGITTSDAKQRWAAVADALVEVQGVRK